VILVDTSVWVAALRGRSAETARTLTSLLDADEVALPLPVRLELSAGVAQADRAVLMRSLRALPVVMPTEETWQQVESWIERAARAGDRFGLSDLLVAALADELGGLVWSLDADFQRMSALKFVRLYD
jgi:predicted nucleic acid-binding protein